MIEKIYGNDENVKYEEEKEVMPYISLPEETKNLDAVDSETFQDKYHYAEEIQEEETLSIHDKELELIKKSLERHQGKRKLAAADLGISERTLYRKIKQYDL